MELGPLTQVALMVHSSFNPVYLIRKDRYLFSANYQHTRWLSEISTRYTQPPEVKSGRTRPGGIHYSRCQHTAQLSVAKLHNSALSRSRRRA